MYVHAVRSWRGLNDHIDTRRRQRQRRRVRERERMRHGRKISQFSNLCKCRKAEDHTEIFLSFTSTLQGLTTLLERGEKKLNYKEKSERKFLFSREKERERKISCKQINWTIFFIRGLLDHLSVNRVLYIRETSGQ